MANLSAQQLEVIDTFQKNYQKQALKALAESGGGTLAEKIGRLTVASNMETAVFYEIEAASTSSTLDFTDSNDPSTAGDIVKYECDIQAVYSKRRVYMNELNKTSLDLGSDFLKSFVRAIDRKMDLIFLEAIDLAVPAIGDNTKEVDEQIKLFIRTCKLAAIRTTGSGDRSKKPILVINSEEYAVLFDKAQVASKDFEKHNADGMFYGCEVMTFNSDVVPSGKAYIIPAETVGAAHWTDNGTSSEYSALFDGTLLNRL